MWSRLFKDCTKCHTVERKHYGGGLCYSCYKRDKYSKNPEPFKRREAERYQRNSKLIRKRVEEYYYQNRKKCLKKLGRYRDKKYFNGLRKQVLDRDANACQSCFGPGQVVHHIDGNGRNSENPNNTMENLITLCRSCHLDIHNAERISRKYEVAL